MVIFVGVALGINVFVDEAVGLDLIRIHLAANEHKVCFLECGNTVEISIVESCRFGFVEIPSAHSAENFAKLVAISVSKEAKTDTVGFFSQIVGESLRTNKANCCVFVPKVAKEAPGCCHSIADTVCLSCDEKPFLADRAECIHIFKLNGIDFFKHNYSSVNSVILSPSKASAASVRMTEQTPKRL